MNKKKIKVCMVAYTFYEMDNRVKRYAEALASKGNTVDVISLRREGQSTFDTINSVSVYRIQKRILDETGPLSYLKKIISFFLRSLFLLTKNHLSSPYDIVHVHSVPDFEVFAAIIPKITGSKIILDIHDIVPEFYVSKFKSKYTKMLFKVLCFCEKISISFSDHVIIANHLWYDTLINRSVRKNKCTPLINYPDKALFFKQKKEKSNNKIIMIYPGTIGWHQGLDIAVKGLSLIKDIVPNLELHIYGDGPERKNIERLVDSLSLADRIKFNGFVSIDEISSIMSNADIGVVPKRNDSFGGEAFSTKILEFMSLEVPVIVSATKIDRYYFNDSLVKFFEPENPVSFSKALLQLIKSREKTDMMVRNAKRHALENCWSEKKKIYFDLINSYVK